MKAKKPDPTETTKTTNSIMVTEKKEQVTDPDVVGTIGPSDETIVALIDKDTIKYMRIEGVEISPESISEVKVKRTKGGKIKVWLFTLTPTQREGMLIKLSLLSREPILEEVKNSIRETFNYLNEHLEDITYTVGEGKIRNFNLTARGDGAQEEEINRKVIEYIHRVETTRAMILNTFGGPIRWEIQQDITTEFDGHPLPPPKDEHEPQEGEEIVSIEIKTEGGEKLTGAVSLHKQPRSYLKTVSKLVGNSTDEPGFFSFPEAKTESGGEFMRSVISRNTAILGNYLLQLWQQSGKEDLVINNLSPLAEMMGNSNYEIKIYLLYLGGYTYPIIDRDEGGGLTLTTEQLFKIQFKYSKKVAGKYEIDKKTGDPLGATMVGSELAKFIKDEPIDRIIVTPNRIFINAIEGKGLGNVLVINDKYVKLALDLTDIAFKILSYSASNKPRQKIAEDNLVKHLGLEKQIKKQGRPRIRATILKGLQELQDKGHIKKYSFDDNTGIYLFTYSSKYIKHSEQKDDK